ncbi:MAG: hypothetical protein ACM3SX_21640 [Deltaproteobacteria bacterium]
MDVSMEWSRGLREVAPWFALQALVPGAALFALLLWLSLRFLRNGFRDVRQHAFVPVGQWTATSGVKRNLWSCTCGSLAACACTAAIARGLRRCCVKLLQLWMLQPAPVR